MWLQQTANSKQQTEQQGTRGGGRINAGKYVGEAKEVPRAPAGELQVDRSWELTCQCNHRECSCRQGFISWVTDVIAHSARGY